LDNSGANRNWKGPDSGVGIVQQKRTEITAGQGEGNPVRRVLVVDDSRLQRRILCSSLKKLGYDIVEAESAERALEICEQGLPDLVLSDWMMPGMNGLEFCRSFRDLSADEYGYFILLKMLFGNKSYR